MAAPMTPFQERCCAALAKAPNGVLCVSRLADAVRSNNLAVSSAMRSLERQGRAGTFPSDDSRWAVRMWYVKNIS